MIKASAPPATNNGLPHAASCGAPAVNHSAIGDRLQVHHYAIALGSNRCHTRHGRPTTIIAAAVQAIAAAGIDVVQVSPTIQSTPIGPARRRFANAAAVIATTLDPPALLSCLKAIERAFGRRAARRWGDRVLDLDIILWSGGRWQSPALTIPHRHWDKRLFVTAPLAAIIPLWCQPRSARTVRHHHVRLRKSQPVDRALNAP